MRNPFYQVTPIALLVSAAATLTACAAPSHTTAKKPLVKTAKPMKKVQAIKKTKVVTAKKTALKKPVVKAVVAPPVVVQTPVEIPKKEVPAVLQFTMKGLDGKDVDLSKYAGKVVMIVNTASKCGFTPQYGGLEKLHEKYADQGLAILGFPANDFGQQEPGSDVEISGFCTKNYGVKFDMFSKVQVTGADKTPLYKLLTDAGTNPQTPGEVQWNFEKFLIGRDGQLLNRFRSAVKPESEEVTGAIEAALKQP
jgi:glutathione peroxidase